jgi:hypothetical protein
LVESKNSLCVNTFVVPGVGIEPTRPSRVRGF